MRWLHASDEAFGDGIVGRAGEVGGGPPTLASPLEGDLLALAAITAPTGGAAHGWREWGRLGTVTS